MWEILSLILSYTVRELLGRILKEKDLKQNESTREDSQFRKDRSTQDLIIFKFYEKVIKVMSISIVV